MRFMAAFVAVFSFLAGTEGRGKFFDCNRVNAECGQGGTCIATGLDNEGQCICKSATLTNADNPCAPADATDCNAPGLCLNGAACKKINGTDTCFCTDEYYGPLCASQRVTVECGLSSMTVSIVPYSDTTTARAFSGIIYNSGHQAECPLEPSSENVYTREFQYNGTETDACVTALGSFFKVTGESGQTNYTVTLRVQHVSTPAMFLGTDLIVEATCYFPTDGTLEPVVLNSVSSEDENADKVITPPVKGQLVQFYARTPNGTSLTQPGDPVRIGEDVSLVFFMEQNDVYSMFLVKSCTVDDGIEGGSSLPLVDDTGCPVPFKGIVVSGHTQTEHRADDLFDGKQGRSVTVPIKAFVFRSSASLRFTCSVPVCDNSDPGSPCAAPTCTDAKDAGISAGFFGRRRREASSEELHLTTTIGVLSSDTPSQTNDSVTTTDGTHSPSSNECLQEPVTQTTITLLGVIAAFLLITCVLQTACCMCRNRRQKGDNYEQESVSSSKLLTIPRPKI